MLRIKKNDKVIVTTGKDKGKTGKILKIFPKSQKVVVERLNMVKKAHRKTQQDQQGGIVEREAVIHLSNLMLIDRKGNKPTRFGTSTLKDGSKQRVAVKSKEAV